MLFSASYFEPSPFYAARNGASSFYGVSSYKGFFAALFLKLLEFVFEGLDLFEESINLGGVSKILLLGSNGDGNSGCVAEKEVFQTGSFVCIE